MKQDYITFERFSDRNSASDLEKILSENKIEFVIENNSLSFDPTFANNNFGKEFCIKIKEIDFGKVNKILSEKSKLDINEINPDYYLLKFSDEDLIDVISKSDEWGKFDVELAKKILKDKGKEITDVKLNEMNQKRIAELSKPEKSQQFYIIIGYFFAFLGGLLGIFIGWHLSTYKKTLPNGNRIFAYSENDQKQGKRIAVIGLFFLVFWVAIRFLK